MASIWIHQPGARQPKKLQGHIPAAEAVARFRTRVAKIAKANPDAVLSTLHDMEAIFTFPDGQRFCLFLEPASPPSAPETGQPHRGKRLVVDGHGTAHKLGAGA